MSDDGPLAYFITFTTYGSRLHGDSRGSVDREHNAHGTPVLEPDPRRESVESSQLIHQPVVLDSRARTLIDAAIREHCFVKRWWLFALNVRTNHVHVVVRPDTAPEQAMQSFKAWSTRRLAQAHVKISGGRVWTRHGSTRYLWTEQDIEDACTYVVYGQ